LGNKFSDKTNKIVLYRTIFLLFQNKILTDYFIVQDFYLIKVNYNIRKHSHPLNKIR
jgi:hypothetical protein